MPHTDGQDDARQREDDDVDELAAIGSHVVLKTIRKVADEELARPTSALAFSGLAAGLSMGFSLVAEGLLRSRLPDEPWRPLVTKVGYSLGFLIVILGRQQLFTENTLTPVVPLLQRRDRATLLNVLRLWATVFATNVVGTVAFAYALRHTAAFSPEVRRACLELGREAMEPTTGTVFVKAVFAGWLIALMVWLLPAAETGSARMGVILILTYVIGLGQLSHAIAGSVDAAYTVFAGDRHWAGYAFHFLLPTVAGNCCGGVGLVAALNYAQVAAGNGGEI